MWKGKLGDFGPRLEFIGNGLDFVLNSTVLLDNALESKDKVYFYKS
jgi:hypothetical protein